MRVFICGTTIHTKTDAANVKTIGAAILFTKMTSFDGKKIIKCDFFLCNTLNLANIISQKCMLYASYGLKQWINDKLPDTKGWP